jgi:hypothetical protein
MRRNDGTDPVDEIGMNNKSTGARIFQQIFRLGGREMPVYRRGICAKHADGDIRFYESNVVSEEESDTVTWAYA